MIAVADSGDGNYPTVGREDFVITAPPPMPAAQHRGYIGNLHRGGANLLFCDGHVQWYAYNDLIIDYATAKGKRNAAMWNYDNLP